MLHLREKLNCTRGLTIIEAIVTMAVLGAGIASVAAATAFIAERVRDNHARFLAASLAERVLEEVRSMGCDPNTVTNPCQRLAKHYNAQGGQNESFPRMYCWPTKGEPRVLLDEADRCDREGDGHLFQVSVFVTTAETASSNSVDFRRRRLTAGEIPQAENVTLDNVANVRVTVRWNDIAPGHRLLSSRTPRFLVYQTRVTQ